MRSIRQLISFFCIAGSSVGLTVLGAEAKLSPEEHYQQKMIPLLKKHCFDCHGPEKQKADLDLSTYTEYQKVAEAPEIWKMVFERVQAFEMPPGKERELKFHEQQAFMEFLRKLPKPKDVDCDQIASDRTQNFYKGYVMSRRLNRAEYNNTVRDLLGVNVNVAELLPADGGGGEGFDTSGDALFTSSIHIEKYLEAADRVAHAVLPERHVPITPAVAKARQALLIAVPGEKLPAREAARQVISAVSKRAFRRPVNDEEVDRFLTMFDRAWARGDDYEAAIRLSLKAILISPNFLFLAEPEPETPGIHRLPAYPLASRLSYFLWSSMPDEELYSLAENGKLLDLNVYQKQIHRMLKDPKARSLGERFALQWLDLERLGSDVRPDARRFPEFTPELAETMRAEVVTYFNYIISTDRSLLELIDSDYSFVNQQLAQLYGLPNVQGDQMQRVSLQTRNRGGIIGMAAVHTLTSFPLRTSPVLRGRWVLESLLGDKVPPPPPEVPALEEEGEKTTHLSLRKQLEVHRLKAECASCHDKMDPLGFGMENFDVLGRWRDTDRDQPIDSAGTLPSGESFSGPEGLKQLLLSRKEKVMRHLARKMTGFAFGREVTRFDECVVDRAMEALKANNYRASALIEQIAVSAPFQQRFYPKQDS